jgi:hypothetical protein
MTRPAVPKPNQDFDMSDPQTVFISRRQAQLRFGFSVERIDQAIKRGEIAAIYPGTKTVKVREADVIRLLATPPRQ